MRTLTRDRARRIALSSLGLARRRPDPQTRRDVRHLRRVMDTVDIVQLDSVNVLARAHEMPFWARLGPHDRAARDRWLWRSREAVEGWAHVASLTAMEVWPLLHHRRRAMAEHQHMQEFEERFPGYVDAVLDEISRHGPRSIRDLDDPGARTGPWWGNPPGKHALDILSRSGQLTIDHRTANFVTVYDRTDRVVPASVRQVEPPPREAAHQQLLLRAARTHGIGTATDLADHYRLRPRDARPQLAALAASGHLEEVRVTGWDGEPVYVHPEATAARRPSARTLLSPFDPLVWFRDRAERLFDFHYRIEIYVPRPKRVHGYYVLPFLLGDRLAARVDLKADRRAGRLLVLGAFAEGGADPAHTARELAEELRDLGAWLEVPEVVVEDHGDLAGYLRRAVRALEG